MDRVDYESVVIQDLLTFHSRDELNLSPWYQRRSVWKPAQKAYLINTIHESKPVPSVYIRHTIDLANEKSVKEVVDGQQRLRAIIEYRNNAFPAPHPSYSKAVTYSQLDATHRKRFLLTALSVGYLVGAEDADVIEIFARINSVAKTLNPQEKRNAQFSGEFKRFCLNESITRLSFWREYAVFTDDNIARMLEVQFVSDLVINLTEGLTDFASRKLDSYYEKFDDAFAADQSIRKRLNRIFESLLNLENLKGTIFCRPQILFSLMLVIDSDPKVPHKKLQACISELDNRIAAARAGESRGTVATDVYEAFTSGNMHRIRLRRIREKAIRELLQ